MQISELILVDVWAVISVIFVDCDQFFKKCIILCLMYWIDYDFKMYSIGCSCDLNEHRERFVIFCCLSFTCLGDHPEDVKARLKYWAQAVACTVRLCS